MANIGVFCSSLDGEKIFSEKAIELGAILAKENHSLVYGGGKLGLMGDLAKGIKSFKKGMASDNIEEDSQKNISENQDSSINQDKENKE